MQTESLGYPWISRHEGVCWCLCHWISVVPHFSILSFLFFEAEIDVFLFLFNSACLIDAFLVMSRILEYRRTMMVRKPSEQEFGIGCIPFFLEGTLVTRGKPLSALLVWWRLFSPFLWFIIHSWSPVCRAAKADLVFMVDGSWSIGDENFNKIINFLYSTVGALDKIGADGTQVRLTDQSLIHSMH